MNVSKLFGHLNPQASELDNILAILGSLCSFCLVIWLIFNFNSTLFEIVGISSLLSCITYLLMRKKSLLTDINRYSSNITSSNLLIFNILYCVLFTLSIISFHFRTNLYIRPISYFFLIALMVSILAIEISVINSKKYNNVILFKIILISVSLEWSQQLLFPELIGIDTWAHSRFTQIILNTGYIPINTVSFYSKMPLYHLTISATSLLTNLNYKLSTMYSIELLHVIITLTIIFLIGKTIYNSKVGLLASLILSTSNYFINFGYWTIPMTLGSIFVVSILYVILSLKKGVSNKLVLLLFAAVLILTHTIAALCVSILLFIYWFSSIIYRMIYNSQKKNENKFWIFVLFSIGMLSMWIYISGHFVLLVKLFRADFSREIYWHDAPVQSSSYFTMPLSEQILSQLGFILFFALAFIGGFYMISKKFGNEKGFLLYLSGFTMLSIGFFPLITGKSSIESRWWFFAQVFLSISVAVAYLLISQTFTKMCKKISIIFIISFLLSSFLIINPQVNLDNSKFFPYSTIRYSFTESELQAMNTITTKWNGDIWGDSFMRSPIPTLQPFTQNLTSQDIYFTNNSLIILRKEVETHTSHGFLRFNYSPSSELTQQGYSKLYSNEEVNAFVKF